MPAGKLVRVPRRNTISKKVKKLSSDVRKLKKNVEIKRHEQVINVTTLDDDSTDVNHVICLSDIAVGNDPDEREGDMVNPLSLKMSMKLISNTGTNQGDTRIVIVQDKNNNDGVSGTLTFGDLYQSDYPLYRMINYDDKGRWRVLHDKLYHFQRTSDNNTTRNTKLVNINIRFNKSSRILYSDNTATSGHKDNIYMLLYSEANDVTVLSTSPWTLEGVSNLIYSSE